VRANIIIDDTLMSKTLKTSRDSIKKPVAEEALKLLVLLKKQGRMKSLRGSLKWEGSLDRMRVLQ